ncbi:MAG TPA: amidohydrolase family protein [Puia sp.]|jgi:cytosine/adenosine deaminase-related metal-dependent hydrolase
MYIRNLLIPGKKGACDLHIENDKITGLFPLPAIPHPSPATPLPSPATTAPAPGLSAPPYPGIDLSLPGAIVFPGLINSHDHLDFNLFPLLGNRIYNNYTAWGRDIHANNAAGIAAVLRIPPDLRTRWGLYKNLLNGFTTVVNHGERLVIGQELITVHQDVHNLHSVGFEKNWKWKLNRPRRSQLLVVLHVGEGTDAAAGQEIDRLIRWNLFKKPLIGIHGVAMNERQAAHFKALVWCPDSNYFLLGKTAPVDKLKSKVPLLFGTDSTLTSGWNSWDQIRLAGREGMVAEGELLAMLTTTAARIWGFDDRGKIAVGQRADLVIADASSLPGSSTSSSLPGSSTSTSLPGSSMPSSSVLYALNPEDLLLVIHKGHIRLFDAALLPQLTAGGLDPRGFYKTTIYGREKYTEGDLPGLMTAIRQYHPEVAFPDGIRID